MFNRNILSFFLIISLIIGLLPESVHAGHVVDSLDLKKKEKTIDSLIQKVDYYMNCDYDSTLYISTRLMKLSESVYSLRGKVKALEGFAAYYFGKGNYFKAIELLYQRLDIHQKYHLMEGYVWAYSKTSGFFYTLGDTAKVLEHIQRGFAVANKTHNPEDRGLMYLSQSAYHYKKKEYSQSRRDALIAAGYFIQSKSMFSEAKAWRLVGDVALQLHQLPQAIDIYLSTIQKFQKIGNMGEAATIYTRIGHVYSLNNDEQKVLFFNRIALQIRKKMVIKDFYAQSLINIGGVYLEMNKRDSALYYLKNGLIILEQTNNYNLLSNAYKQFYYYYLKYKNDQQSFKYYRLYRETNQAFINESNNIEIRKLNASWEISEKERQNKVLKQEHALHEIQLHNRIVQTILFEAGFLFFFFLTLIVDHFIRHNKQRKQSLQKLNENIVIKINERIEAESILRQSEIRYRFLAEHLVDVISVVDVNLKRLFISPSCKKFYGYEPREILDQESIFTIVDPAYHEFVRAQLSEIIRLKIPGRYSYKAIRKDGTHFWAESNLNPVIDPKTGDFKELITIIRDISERKKYEEMLSNNARQKEMLLREIHNRVKNNFAILTSLMTMQCDITHDTELNQSLCDLQLRLRTMSLVHEQLYNTQGINIISFGNYLNNLATIISTAFHNDRISLSLDIDPCELSIDITLPLGLIVNELLTNACKYAFPDNRSGHVWVSLKPLTDHRWCITINDDGVGLPADFSLRKTQSMGSKIIQILIEQIEATLEIQSENGTCFKIYFSS
ncbi:MAG: PAS domain S-box protein [Bacteroidales bacterium]|nr:PAS domain S-box protein [Bacteroidales bacterium]